MQMSRKGRSNRPDARAGGAVCRYCICSEPLPFASIPDISGIFKCFFQKYNNSNAIFTRGGGPIIVYDPLWQTMRRKGITTYTLIKDYSFSKGTLDSLKHNRNISTATLNDLCQILDCSVEEVLCYIPAGTPEPDAKKRPD